MGAAYHPPSTWNIGLSAWIIQDGNYPDFEVGQTAEFALEFWLPDGVTGRASSGELSAHNAGGCLYDTVADVVLQTEDITILDIGVQAYGESSSLRSSLPRVPRVAVQLGLGVDPFFYFEGLRNVADVPPLVYSWQILSILRQTAPFIEKVAETGPLLARKVWVRDPQRLGYEEILKTDAWSDDDGYAEYLLRCDLLPIPPKRASATSTD
jgi:hypothetical protein